MRKATPRPAESNGTDRLDQSGLRKYAGYFLARARFVSFRTFDEHIGEPFNLRPVEFTLMLLLDSNGQATQKQLSQSLGVAQPNMTGLLRRLEERGLLERTRGERDKRMQFITLSAAGRKLVRQANAAGTGMDDAWLGNLTKAERGMLVELLEKVTSSRPAQLAEAPSVKTAS
ncbi:MAG TPA: MarR family transcriptional regulator [Ramlibacter sp.]|nr:MarR family transcriptional regulator [Ramlibacter sp.]